MIMHAQLKNLNDIKIDSSHEGSHNRCLRVYRNPYDRVPVHTGKYQIAGLARKKPAQVSGAHNISWVKGDILNPDKIVETISAINPDAVIHLAGLNRGSLQELQKTNVTGTQNILDAALKDKSGLSHPCDQFFCGLWIRRKDTDC